jgi:hypothetical protein
MGCISCQILIILNPPCKMSSFVLVLTTQLLSRSGAPQPLTLLPASDTKVKPMPSKLMDYFNKSPRIGTLSTADSAGNVDSAVFGSPRMTDEKTVVMGLGQNRTLANLQQNPHAVFLIVEPGETFLEWKGIRVYLSAKTISTSGSMFDNFKAEMAKVAGEEAAEMVHALVIFEVTGIRPLIDMGQGWEKSV